MRAHSRVILRDFVLCQCRRRCVFHAYICTSPRSVPANPGAAAIYCSSLLLQDFALVKVNQKSPMPPSMPDQQKQYIHHEPNTPSTSALPTHAHAHKNMETNRAHTHTRLVNGAQKWQGVAGMGTPSNRFNLKLKSILTGHLEEGTFAGAPAAHRSI